MADTTGNTRDVGVPGGADSAPRKSSWRHIGPGIVVAATGVGAGDLVATLIAGSNFGYTLLWAAVIGCLEQGEPRSGRHMRTQVPANPH
ncbi:hypothetical protein AB0B09_15195, partial [Streptomyces sp. NPDC044948]